MSSQPSWAERKSPRAGSQALFLAAGGRIPRVLSPGDALLSVGSCPASARAPRQHLPAIGSVQIPKTRAVPLVTPLGPGASSKAASWGIIHLPRRKSPRTPEDGQTAALASVSPRGAAVKARALMTRSLPSTSPPSLPAALREGRQGAPAAAKTPLPVLAFRDSQPGRGPRRRPGWAWRAAAGPARTSRPSGPAPAARPGPAASARSG